MTTSILRTGLEQAGVTPDLASRLAAFGEKLLEANTRVNLTGARTPEQLLPHVLDSLTLASYVRGPLVDVGSGGGLPAIPLALALNIEVTLVESVGKKCLFLKDVLREFRIAGTVVPKRAEEVGHDPVFRERFATGTGRAVATAPTVLELVVPLLRIGGRAVLQRGRMESSEQDAVTDAAPMLGAILEEVVDLGRERRILILAKNGSTAQRFPRRAGIPEKRPLCL